MREYMLVQNLMFNCKHVKLVRWYHIVFGTSEIVIDKVMAADEIIAKKKFKLKGYNFGFLG